jgi:hypothetical protein
LIQYQKAHLVHKATLEKMVVMDATGVMVKKVTKAVKVL